MSAEPERAENECSMGGAVAKGQLRTNDGARDGGADLKLLVPSAIRQSPRAYPTHITRKLPIAARTLQSMSRHNYSVSPRLSALSEPRRKSTSYDHPIAATRAKFLNPGDAEDDDPLFGQDDDGTKSYVTHQSTGAGAVLGVPILAVGKHTFVTKLSMRIGTVMAFFFMSADAEFASAKEAAVGPIHHTTIRSGGSPYRRDGGSNPRPRHSWLPHSPASASFTRRKGACHRRHGRGLPLPSTMEAGRRGCRLLTSCACVTLASPGDAISLHSVNTVHKHVRGGSAVLGRLLCRYFPSRAEARRSFEPVRAARIRYVRTPGGRRAHTAG